MRAYKAEHGNRGFRGTDEGEGAVRLRVPDEGATVVRDVIRGETAFENALLDDLVIARADGTPTYHLAVVGDDGESREYLIPQGRHLHVQEGSYVRAGDRLTGCRL